MKRPLLTVVLVASLIVPAADAGPDTSTRGRPALKVLSFDPLVVRGGAFKAREVVRVTAVTEAGTFVKRVTASSTGVFTVAFEQIEIVRRCRTDLSILAHGSRGSRATVTMPSDLCLPPP